MKAKKRIRLLNWYDGKIKQLQKVLVIEKTALTIREQIETFERSATTARRIRKWN